MIEKDYDEDSKFYRKSQRAGEGESGMSKVFLKITSESRLAKQKE